MPYSDILDLQHSDSPVEIPEKMELNSAANMMDFSVNHATESEAMMGYEDISEYENLDTMGIETEIVDPFQDDFERGNVTDPMDSPIREHSPSVSFNNNANISSIGSLSSGTELVDPFQQNYGPGVQGQPLNSIMEFPISENLSSDHLMKFGKNQTINSSYIPPEFTVPYQTKVDHEIIAISDDEEEDEKMRQPQFLVKPSQRPLFPTFRQPRIPVPMMPMKNIATTDSEVITLSDDDDAARPFQQGIKRKKTSRRRAIMFHPQICPFCRKQLRDNICMAKHLIKHHWERIRMHNSGGKKGTDYFNLKDDREIPAEKYEDERPRYTPLPPSGPPRMPPIHAFRQRDEMAIGQPLKPTFMQGMQPPYRGFPGKADNGNIGKPGTFSHQPSTSMTNPTVTIPDSDSEKEARTDTADDFGHPDNRKMVQQKLGILMHAHKCDGKKPNRKQNSFFQEEAKDCTLPECKDTKELLKHLPGCTAGSDCLIAECFMSKQIIKWALSGQSPGVLTEMRSELNRQAKAGLPQDILQWALKHPFEKEQWKSWRDTKQRQQLDIKSHGPTQSSSLPTTLLNMSNVFPPNQPISTIIPSTTQPVSLDLSSSTQPSSSIVSLSGFSKPSPGNLVTQSPNIGTVGKLPTLQRKPMSAEKPKEPPKPEIAAQPTPQAQQVENKPISDWKKKYIEAAEKRRVAQTARKPPTQQPKTDKVVPSAAPADLLSGLLSSQDATAELRKVRKPEPIIDKRYQNVNKRLTPPTTKPSTTSPTPPLQATTSGQEAAMYNSMLSL